MGKYKVKIKMKDGKTYNRYFNDRYKMIDYISIMKYYGINEIQAYKSIYIKTDTKKEEKEWNEEREYEKWIKKLIRSE